MSAHLAGKSIAFTGEFAGMTRAQVTQVAKAAGATVTSNVSPKTDFLVCGKGPGPKAANANAMGVTMLSQPQFHRFIKNVPAQQPVMAQPVPVQYQQPGAVQYPAQYMAMAKAPRGRRPMTAQPMAAAPVQTYAAPAPVAPQPTFTNQAVNLRGQTLTFTGTLETATREEAGAMAAQAGAEVVSAITPATNFVVVGSTPGQTKMVAAQAAGIRTISEEQFMKAAIPSVNAMPEQASYAAPAPVMAQPAPAMTMAAPMMTRRGRKPRMAAPVYAAPVAEAPTGAMPWETEAVAPMAVATPAPVVAAPMYEAPTTGAMPWETDVFAAAPVAAAPTPRVRAPRAPKMAAPVPVMPVPTPMAAAPVVAAPVAPIAQTGKITLAGQNVVFTGTLQVNRMVAATMASKVGAMVTAALTSKTNLLVCGANAGEKMAKAQAMGIRVITEAEFVAACRN